jgi:PEP-CTERM motif
MGTFKVDPPGDELFTDDIFVAGPGQEAGTYVGQTSGGNVLFYSDSAANSALLLRFDLDLGAPQLQLTSVEWEHSPNFSFASELGGGARLPTAVPEPSTWMMMLMGFAGLGYAALRRKAEPRRARA